MNTAKTITLRLKVTQDDIAKGIAGVCSRCPVALAFERAFTEMFPRRVAVVTVGTHSLSAMAKDLDYPHQTFDIQVPNKGYFPPQAVGFIYDFDCHRKVEPFEFDLAINVTPTKLDFARISVPE